MDDAVQNESRAPRAQPSGTRPKLDALKPVVKSLISTVSAQVPIRSETAIEAKAKERQQGQELEEGSQKNGEDSTSNDSKYTKDQLEELRAKTMFQMVSKGPGERRIVFLSNRQASVFKSENIGKLLDAFELNSPKLVVRLLASTNGSDGLDNDLPTCMYKPDYSKPFDRKIIENNDFWKTLIDVESGVLPFLSFVEDSEGFDAERKMDIFTMEVLIPLCEKTNAVVICTPTRACSLGMSFGKAANFLASTKGDKLPFTILAIDSASKYESLCETAGEFRQFCSAWEKRSDKIVELQTREFKAKECLKGMVQAREFNPKEEFERRIFSDLNPYIQNIIMVDGVDEETDTLCTKQMEKLRMLILSHFITTLPCVAIGTLRQGKDGWKDSACLVQKSIPVLYIDVRKRPEDLEKEANMLKTKVQKKKEEEVKEKPEVQRALTCSEAIKEDQPGLKAAEKHINTAWAYDNELPEEEKALSCLKAQKKDQPGLYAAKKLEDTAREYCKQEWEYLACHKRYDILDACRIAFWHSIYERMKNLSSADGNLQVSDDDVSIYNAIELAKIKTEVVSIYDKIEQAKGPCQDPKNQALLSLLQTSVSDIVLPMIHYQFKSYFQCLSKEKQAGSSYQIYFERSIHQTYMYAHILFQSPHFYSAHVEDVGPLKQMLDNIVMNSRLPPKENLEGLRVLRSAWNVIDIGQFNLRAYKYLSKFIYLFMLASGIATVCLTVFTAFIDASVTEIDVNMTPSGSIIFYLSVVTTFVTAFNAYINPGGRWRQIRDTTCRLESAIWQYRTRSGLFKIKLNEVDEASSFLKNAVSHSVETLVNTSDIGQSTSWSKFYPKSVYKHGQYQPLEKKAFLAGIPSLSKTDSKVSPGVIRQPKKYLLPDDWQYNEQETQKSSSGILGWSSYHADEFEESEEFKELKDNHHSPLTPEKYVRFRLLPVVRFYKQRLPSYTRTRNIMSVMLMMVTAAGTILAYKQLSSYVSICATTAAAITSWMEYNNIATKIGRYNSTVSSLESLILWWSSISDVEKSVISNIDTLVKTGEQVINAERAAWLSTPVKKEKSATEKRSSEEKEEKGASQEKEDREAKDPPTKQSTSKPKDS